MPRMPVHATRNTALGRGSGSRLRISALHQRGTYVPIGVHSRRTTIATRLRHPRRADRSQRSGGNLAQQPRELGAQHHEDQRVEQKHDQIPYGARLHAGDRSHRGGQVLAHVQAAGHAREDGGHVQGLRGHPRDVRSQQREQGLGQAWSLERAGPNDEPSHRDADQRADPGVDEEPTTDSPQLNAPVTAAATAVR